MKNQARRAAERSPYLFLKRLLDVVFSLLLLILLAFPMSIIGIAVGLSSRGGVIFRQMRIGREGKPFICYKFRTMVRHAPPERPSSAFDDVARYVTPVGRFLRKTSLDELPQLWNVLRGDMSLVGPRPLIGAEQGVHSLRAEHGVYRVRPGMTGLAQVMGRDRLGDSEKAAFDARYVERLCLREDLWIVGKTLLHLFEKETVK